jgi:hypothetical protein
MAKSINKTVLITAVLLLIIIVLGLFFYYWNGQKEIRILNEGLPEGVGVVKTITNEYKIENDLDGYKFRIPKEWEGVGEIFYTPQRTENSYTTATIELEGKEGGSIILIVNKFHGDDEELTEWAENNFNNFELVGNFSEDNVNGIEVVKTTEDVHLLGMWVYFFEKDGFVYAITNGSEDYIKYIIANGEW